MRTRPSCMLLEPIRQCRCIQLATHAHVCFRPCCYNLSLKAPPPAPSTCSTAALPHPGVVSVRKGGVGPICLIGTGPFRIGSSRAVCACSARQLACSRCTYRERWQLCSTLDLFESQQTSTCIHTHPTLLAGAPLPLPWPCAMACCTIGPLGHSSL